jgi:hypothetical protein
LWDLRDLDPGPYVERYSLAGYEPVEGTFLLDAFGENDVENLFVSRGTVGLDEAHLLATISPFALSIRDGDSLADGIAGVSAAYSGGDIVVTFSRPIAQPNAGDVYFYDYESGDPAFATVDSAGQVFTISAASIAAIDGGNGPAADNDPYTWGSAVFVNFVSSYTPIHGSQETMDAELYLNVLP